MNSKELDLTRKPAKDQEAALRQRQQERLARLFRQVGDSADGRYLLQIMTRYRELKPA